MKRLTQRGQSTIEYALVAAGLAAALFVVEYDGRTAAQYLANAVRAVYASLTYYLSLP
jgi:hypothetical protein